MTWLWCLLSFFGGATIGFGWRVLVIVRSIRHLHKATDMLVEAVEHDDDDVSRAPVTIATPWYEHTSGFTTRTRYH